MTLNSKVHSSESATEERKRSIWSSGDEFMIRAVTPICIFCTAILLGAAAYFVVRPAILRRELFELICVGIPL
jgi:hypothetical protein